MGNSSPHASLKQNHEAHNAFDVLPRELHEVIGGYTWFTFEGASDLLNFYFRIRSCRKIGKPSLTVFSGPIRLVAFNKHRISIDVLERIGAFDRLSFCLDLRYCQRLGEDEDFLEITQYNNIYELDLRGIEFKYDIDPDLGHLTSLRRLAICQNRDKPITSYSFVSKLTKLNSLIIQQDGYGSLDEFSSFKLDLKNLLPLTNLKELAINPYMEQCAIIEPVTQLTSLKTLVLNCGYGFGSSLDVKKLTVLTNLKTLIIDKVCHAVTPEDFTEYADIKWQTSLERIYDTGAARLTKFNAVWTELPEKKFRVGETIVVDVFNSHYKVGFY